MDSYKVNDELIPGVEFDTLNFNTLGEEITSRLNEFNNAPSTVSEAQFSWTDPSENFSGVETTWDYQPWQVATEQDAAQFDTAETIEPTMATYTRSYTPEYLNNIWYPQTNFQGSGTPAFQSAVSDGIEHGASDIEEIEVTSDMIEGTEVAAEASMGPLALLAVASAGMQQAFGAISNSKSAQFNSNAQMAYQDSMANGHGIGFQALAAENLSNAFNASHQYTEEANILSALMGPVGAAIGSVLPVSSPAGLDTFTATTASGEQANAQAPDVISMDTT